jgi:hypothetical protein
MNEYAPGSRRSGIKIPRKFVIFYIILVSLVAIGIFAFFGGRGLVQKKVELALRNLPPAFTVEYSSIEANVFTGSLTIHDLRVRYHPVPDSSHKHEININELAIRGIGYLSLLASHRLHIRLVRLVGCEATLDDYLLEKKIPLPKMQGRPPFTEASLDEFEIADIKARVYKEEQKKDGRKDKRGHMAIRETMGYDGSLTIRSIHLKNLQQFLDNKNLHQPIDSSTLQYGGIRMLGRSVYLGPNNDEKIRLKNVELNSGDSLLRIGSARIDPSVDKLEIGRARGIQVDVVQGTNEGIEVSGLDVKALIEQRLIADKITIRKSNLHVFRDRRLPRDEDEKPMPMDFLKRQAVSIRVKTVNFAATNFTYEEFPAKGDQTGTLRIVGLSGSLSPLINHPVEGDPAYLTLRSEGSLMGSGTVTATTKMPLREGEPYRVAGVFRELDVTRLNPSAENLGGIHLESGILNSLAFQFEMTSEKATGKIVGEYHNLVVQKLRGLKEPKKVDKLKSFALKAFIIPLNKDRSLPESKRTGVVDYKRDPSRMFSYYLLHSLLVGVKKSFSLGFLLPG